MDERATNLSIDDLIRHGSFVRALARRLVADESSADDVVQEVWLRALQRPPAHGGSITGWLASVARNLVRDRASAESARRDHELRRVEFSSEEPRPEQRSGIVEAIAAAFAGLPALYRDALYLRYYEDKPPPQIATELDCPLATVKTRLSRGIELLRQDLEQRTRARGKELSALIAGLVSTQKHSAVASGSILGGLFVINKFVAAAVILIACATGWWVWRAQGVDTASNDPTHASSGELAVPNTTSTRSVIAADARDVAPIATNASARTLAEGWHHVRVLDESHSALVAVEVRSVSKTAVELLGSTNTEGRLNLQPLPLSAERLVFSLAGFAVREIPPPKTEERELEIVLQRGSAISGRAVIAAARTDDDQPAEGVCVTATLTSNRARDLDRFARLQLGDPSVRCDVTDANGAFSIDGLVVGESYALRAGGRGLIQSERVPRQASVVPCDGLLIELDRAYGVAFEFVDEVSGKVIDFGDLAGGGLSTTVSSRAATSIPTGGMKSFLAGLDPKQYGDKRLLSCLASSTEATDEAGPIQLTVRLAGYEETRLEAMARPLTETMPVVRVPLEQTAAGFGTIALTWIGVNESFKEIGPQPFPPGEVSLVGADGSSLTLRAPLELGVEHVLGRVPVGNYQVSVSANNHAFVYPAKDLPPKTIAVEADRRTLISVPLVGTGSIFIELERPGGSAHDGTFQLQLSRAESAVSGFITFRAPPYRIIALDPGTYSFEIYQPGDFRRNQELQPAPVVVTAGGESVVRVRIP